MLSVNENYLKLPGSYLFANISQKVKEFEESNPKANIIRLGIGDVTRPLVPAVINALHEAVDQQAAGESFKGYAPDGGYDFLRQAIVKNDFETRGAAIHANEVFVSDGAKTDSANIQEIFGPDIKIAVGDPVYPVYVDSNIMAGRGGEWNDDTQKWSDLVYLSATAENDFKPEYPSSDVDVVYLCYPNNPTGTTLTKAELQGWVDWANENNAVIIYDAAYEAFITEDDVAHSIYECEGARSCAIEIRSFSKRAGFTGLRLGYTVVPEDIVINGTKLYDLWKRRTGSKFNGAPYIVQYAGAATYSDEAQAQIQETVDYYMRNTKTIRDGLVAAGYEVYGGINAPYIWLKTPVGISSWEFFDKLLNEAQVVGTPGVGFGPSGEGYFRLTAFGTYENTVEAIDRIKALSK